MVERKEGEESSQGADAISLATRESNSDLYHKNVNDHQHDGPALWWGPFYTFKGCRVGFPWKLGVATAWSNMSQRTGLISRN